MVGPDRICATCSGYEHMEPDRLGMCFQQHSPEYFCAVLETHTCPLWKWHGTVFGELEVKKNG